ncbi:hypothetical protein PoB_002624100 [Plakobranchus ocellatus]|uniref:Uncharacterized protein n=1 Tax=Plakobranchus ocellatus TaxID=259542 RepID=A0AAV3ZUW5_9GAST|nr:hypothetical protein PoB_002624100 [Plakobranchus ocellatus]
MKKKTERKLEAVGDIDGKHSHTRPSSGKEKEQPYIAKLVQSRSFQSHQSFADKSKPCTGLATRWGAATFKATSLLLIQQQAYYPLGHQMETQDLGGVQ